MSQILVTGANGFIGRHVSRVCAQHGHSVVGIGHGDWSQETWHCWGLSAWHELDVTVASLLAHAGQPDVVIHCAGSGSVGFSLENPAQDFERTVGTTLEVLEYLRTCAPQARLIYPSSAAVYGRVAALPIAEDAPLDPISPYGMHKKIGEDLCRSYARNFAMPIAVVRVFSAYGVELRKQLLWDACRKAMTGDCRFAGTGHETRDWVNVEDVASLLLVAADFASPCLPIVNGATGIEVEIGELVTTLFDALGTPRRPEFTGDRRSGDPDRYAGDVRRAREWGWEPRRGWQDGVREYARWFQRLAP